MVAAQKKNAKVKNVFYRTGKDVRFKTAKEYQAGMTAWCKKAENKGKLREFEDEFFDVVYENYEPNTGTYKVAMKLFKQKRKEQDEAEGVVLTAKEAEDEEDSDIAEWDSDEKIEEASDYEGEDDDSDGEDEGEDDDSDGEDENEDADAKGWKAQIAALKAENAELKKVKKAVAKKPAAKKPAAKKPAAKKPAVKKAKKPADDDDDDDATADEGDDDDR
jgi:hypothetical protein